MSSKFTRTTPESALRIATKEERGKLKIFLGYAPGVGKTYAMLNEAKRRIKYGQKVVIGYIETHYRDETEKNKSGILEIPLKEIEYKGKKFYEPNVEEIIKYKPDIVLIDELAHTNVTYSKNKKRYEDVQEILEAGISVLTTLNIQHIDTLKFLTTNITRVDVRETVPYEIIDNADEVIVIDISPDKLIQRLNNGNIFNDNYRKATQNYFQKSTLSALREICLKATAEEVEEDLLLYMKEKNISLNWHVAERIMVLISSEAEDRKLVLRGAALAKKFNSDWFVVSTRKEYIFEGSNKHSLIENKIKKMTEGMGGEFILINEKQGVNSIKSFIKTNYITFVIVGNSMSSKKRIRNFIRMNMVTKLIKETDEVEFHIIPT